ncbi:MAG: hypothetical protein JXR10_09380 [Cyclobacteriaceae bacterium]
MRRFVFLVVVLSFAVKAHSQEFSSETWHDGYLVNTDGDTIRGLLKYDLEANIVQLIRSKVVQTYSSHKVFYFQIFDNVVDNYRQFYSIPYNVSSDYKVPVIFEVLYEGPLSLLSRESIVQETVNNTSAYWGGGGYVRSSVKYVFYFLDKRGNIKRFTGKKADLMVIMSKHQNDVKKFIKNNRMQIEDIRDLIRITAFYNSL